MRRERHPRLTVCVPVYNGAEYIAGCIESVLAQTFDDFRLIVCDNCSTDDTGEIVRSYTDPRLRYVRNDRNLGLVGNENRCLALAESPYVALFHHDDVMLPDNLGRKVAVLDAHPTVGFVHSNLRLMDGAGAELGAEIWAPDSRRDYVEKGGAVFARFVTRMAYGASIFIGTVVARRSCYDAVGPFEERLPHCSDSEMLMRMMLFFDVACIGEPLIRYRLHAASTSSAFGDYRSLPYLREHHQAVSFVFERHGARIPDRRRLLKAASWAFASRMLDLAATELVEGRSVSARALLKDALRIDPGRVGASPRFWRAVAAALIGRDGIQVYRKVKTTLRAV